MFPEFRFNLSIFQNKISFFQSFLKIFFVTSDMNDNRYSLDKIDRKILSALHKDGRLTIAQLADLVGLSSSPCWTRVKRLENLKIIEGYSLYVYPRPNCEISENYINHPHVKIVNAPRMEISSSFIRKCRQEGKSVQGFMPAAAWKYLDEMNFYKKTSL